MTPLITVGGKPVERIDVHVPNAGVWWADVAMIEQPDISGRVSITIGELQLEGSVDASRSGSNELRQRLRVVGGAGGWATLLPAKAYHNDAGVPATTVIEDAAREAGETLGTISASPARVGVDYVRKAGPASSIISEAAGEGVLWWVDYAGRTHVGTRPPTDAMDGSYIVLEHEPDVHVVHLAVDDLRDVVIGSRLSVGLDGVETVRELTIEATPDQVRVSAWCGLAALRGRLQDAMRSVIDRSTGGRLHGLWRYRVVQMSVDRVELQAVAREAGLPDVLPVSMWPGVAGAHAELAPGSEVLVEFIEGRPTMPIITHFAGKDGAGWTPTRVILSASQRIRLGSPTANDFVALASKVKTALDRLAGAFNGWTPVPNDGGAALKTALTSAGIVGSTWPDSVAASKVSAE